MQTDTLPRTSVSHDSQAPSAPPSASIAATAPGQLRVIKRNGTVVTYDDSKIAVAMTKAFLAVEGGTAAASSRIREQVRSLVDQMSATFERRFPSGGTLHIEDIQDQVELALMRSGEHKVARDYVIYRDSRARARAERKPVAKPAQTTLSVTRADGSRAPLDVERLRTVVSEACEGLKDVDSERIIIEALNNMYDGISEKDVATSVLITARTLVEEEPNYTFVTARILLDDLRAEALALPRRSGTRAAAGDFRATQSQMRDVYPVALKAFIERGASSNSSRADLAQVRSRPARRSVEAGARPQLHVPRPADAVRPLLHSQQRRSLRTAAGVLHARRDGPRARRRPIAPHARSSSTTCCRRSTTWSPRRRCSTQARCARNCRRAS